MNRDQQTGKDDITSLLEVKLVRRDGTGDEGRALSYAQERVYFADQMGGSARAYNVAMKLEIEGTLDEDALRSALITVIQRHEALRTIFVISPSGSVQQIVKAEAKMEVPVFDLTDRSSAEQKTEVLRFQSEVGQERFDLARGPLMRARLVRCSTSYHVLLLAIHHIVVDRWSMKILLHELFEIYSAELDGRTPQLSASSTRYVDYAQQQMEWLAGDVRKKQLAYWKGILAEDPELFPIAPDFPRSPRQSFCGERAVSVVPEDLVGSLRKMAQQESASLFMVLAAAFHALLHRYSGHDHIAFAYPAANRGRFKVANTVGFFVNTLLLPANFSDNPTFRDLLRQVRNTLLDNHDHQDVPFEQVMEAAFSERQSGASTPFQAMFVLQEDPLQGVAVPGLRLKCYEVGTGTSKFDLLITMEDHPDELEATIEYNTDLFEAETIRAFLLHFQTVLDSIAQSPDTGISDLALLTEHEHQQLVEWNNTRQPYPEACIHQIFESQVESAPDSIAVICGEQRLTYRELNQAANRIATDLLALGVNADTRVGLCADRSPAMVAALLAILKAGGAYVPLDAAYPTERLQFMVRDAGIEVILADSKCVSLSRALVKHVVQLKASSDPPAQDNLPNIHGHAKPDSLAYVVYTSGSTGQPKGVEVPHRGVTRLLFNSGFVSLDDSQVFLHLAPLSFDASTFEIWGGLLHGGQCVLFPQSPPTASQLETVVQKYGVTTLWLTSSLFNCIIAESPEALSSIRQLIVGGEALSVPHVRQALDLLPNTDLHNGYGPTESTTFTCTYRIPRDFAAKAISVPIGKPIGNTQVYVLDQYHHLLPVGVPGELYIGGDGLARGYLNRPELNAQFFLKNQFGEGRLYRTGDIVRCRRDGNLEFIRRVDNQVKINGFRIELGEIESLLLRCPPVKAAAALVHEEPKTGKRVVVYAETESQTDQVKIEIRKFLARKLPEFLTPAEIVLMQALPLTENGKLDRNRLPKPQNQASAAKTLLSPRNETEAKLLEIWKDLLGHTEIGTDQDFFKLGGTSLLLTRLLVRIEKAFGRRLDIATIFEAPTICSLAIRVRGLDRNPRARRVVPFQPLGTLPPFFCVGAGPFLRPLAKLLGSDRPFLGLGLSHTDKQWLKLSTRLEEIASHLVTSLREYQPEGPYYIGGWCHDGVLAFEVARQLEEQGQTVALLAMFDSQNPAWAEVQSVRSRIRIMHSRIRFQFRTAVSHGLRSSLPQWRSRLMDTLVRFNRMRRIALAGRAENSAEETPQGDLLEDVLFHSVNRYRPKTYRGPVAIFQCQDRPADVFFSCVESWRGILEGAIRVLEMPGGHRSMFLEPNVSILARSLEDCMHQ